MPLPDPDLVPVFEELPAFEEEDLPPPKPTPLTGRLLGESTPAARQVGLLGERLRALGRDRRLRRLGVASASRGDGCSSVALGLAQALAQGDRHRVLLVELDVLCPTVDATFSFAAPETGLRQYLEDDSRGVVTVRRLSPASVWTLSAGKEESTGLEALASARLVALLTSADRVFDYTVLDFPPLLEGGEARMLQDQADGVVFVVRTRHTKRDAVRQAARLLDRDRLCGYVLNAGRA